MNDFYKSDKFTKVQLIDILLEKSLSIIEEQFIQHNIEIITDLQSTNKIKQFENELLQVFLNIFQNRLDNFKEIDIENKNLIISSHDNDQGGVIITILDNSSRINENIMDKIFDPYYSLKNEEDFKGVGFYIYKDIIEQKHSGVLKVANKSDGVEFSIEF